MTKNLQALRFFPSDRIIVIQHHRRRKNSLSDIRFSFIILFSSPMSVTGKSSMSAKLKIFDDLEAPLSNSSLISLDERTSCMSHFSISRLYLSASLAPSSSSLQLSYQASSVLTNSLPKTLSFHFESTSRCSQT